MSVLDLVTNFLKQLSGVQPTAEEDANTNETSLEDNTMFYGNAPDAVQTALGTIGVKRGAVLQIKTTSKCNPLELDKQYEVKYVNNDGSVGISPLVRDGKCASM